MSRTLNQDSVHVYDGRYFSDHFCAELSWHVIVRVYICCEVEYMHKCLGCS